MLRNSASRLGADPALDSESHTMSQQRRQRRIGASQSAGTDRIRRGQPRVNAEEAFHDLPQPLSRHRDSKRPAHRFRLRHSERLSGKPALIDAASGRSLTYGQIADSIRRVAAGLWERGLRKGDVAAISAPTDPDYAIAFYAVASIGGIVTTVNPLFTAEEAREDSSTTQGPASW